MLDAATEKLCLLCAQLRVRFIQTSDCPEAVVYFRSFWAGRA